MTAAYQSTPQSVDTAKLTTTIASTCVLFAGVVIQVIVIYLVGMFGCSRAGNVYCTCAKVIDERHNKDLSTRRSHTYIDDGLLISPRRLLDASIQDYCFCIETLLGKGSINYDKVEIWGNGLIGIGWEFDFVSWTVQPKRRGLAKILIALFILIPPRARTVRVDDLATVTGLLTWYSKGDPCWTKLCIITFCVQEQI